MTESGISLYLIVILTSLCPAICGLDPSGWIPHRSKEYPERFDKYSSYTNALRSSDWMPEWTLATERMYRDYLINAYTMDDFPNVTIEIPWLRGENIDPPGEMSQVK